MVFRRWAWLSKRALLVIVFLKQAYGGILPWFLSLSFYSFFLCPLWKMGSVHICMSTLVHSIDHSDAFIQHTKKLQDKASCLPSFYIQTWLLFFHDLFPLNGCPCMFPFNFSLDEGEEKGLLALTPSVCF